LLKIISGLLFPQRGSIQLMGYEPKDRYPELMREIYLVTEEFHLPSLKIAQYIKLYSPFYPRFNYSLFDEYIREFNLQHDQKLSALSYGQKKNFLLSFGLATDCKLLILDEPTNGLDIPSKSQFRKIVANAIHEERSFIISTHQVRDMENLIDPVIILDDGDVVFFEGYENISRKLAITRETTLPDKKILVYAESYLGAYSVVKENTTMEETSMNLEILFNAVVSNKSRIREIFKTPAA
jgi:ABC-2 type transport system ATP-binding protein